MNQYFNDKSSIFLTEVNFLTSEENQLSYFQNGLFFKILLSFHEPHNQVKYRWKNEVFSELFTNTFFEIIFVTFVSNKSLRCLYHTWIVFWKSDFWMIFVYTNHSASLAIHASIALRNSKKSMCRQFDTIATTDFRVHWTNVQNNLCTYLFHLSDHCKI